MKNKIVRTVSIFIFCLAVISFALVSVVKQGGVTTPSQTAATGNVKMTKDTSGAPFVTDFSFTQTGKDTVEIFLATNKSTTATVQYGKGEKYDMVVKDATFSGKHTLLLSKLLSKTAYGYSISITDALGNITTVPGETFRLGSNDNPPIARVRVTNLQVTGIGTNQVTVSWETPSVPTTTVVEYGFSSGLGTTVVNPGLAVYHSIGLSSLLPQQLYRFRVRSDDVFGNHGWSSIATFTTLPMLSCGNAPGTPDASREMFVWLYADDIITPGSARGADLFSFTDAKNISTIYLNTNLSDLQNSTFTTNLKSFLNTAMNQHCVKVELLSGAPNWIAYPNNGYIKGECNDTIDNEILADDGVPPDTLIDYPTDPQCTSVFDTNEAIAGLQSDYSTEAVDWINAGVAFSNSITAGNMKPVGMHADLEPHGFSVGNYPGFDYYWNWSNGTDNMNAVLPYLNVLQNMKMAIGTSGVKLTVDVPRWFDNAFILQNVVYHNLTKNLYKHVADMFDDISVFDYVTSDADCMTPGSICYDGAAELVYVLPNPAKSVKLVVEAGDVDTQGGTNGVHSFWTLQCNQMDGPTGALATTYGHLTTAGYLSRFGGFVVDPYYEDNRPGSAVDSGYNILCP